MVSALCFAGAESSSLLYRSALPSAVWLERMEFAWLASFQSSISVAFQGATEWVVLRLET